MYNPEEFYWRRVDRNLGIISIDEQERLRGCTVAIAGCGGMGGQIAVACARIGVGRIKISDNQSFDDSNLNRQYAASLHTLGESKALSTYAELKRIVGDDIEVECDVHGVNAGNVDDFVSDADFIFDEIEFFQLCPRILLHQAARRHGKKVLNCNVVGFGSRIFLFTPDSMTMEEFLGVDENTLLTEAVIRRILSRLAPNLPPDFSNEVVEDWIIRQQKAPIFGATPLLSTGLVMDRFVLEFLGTSRRPWVRAIPPMPAYGYLDVALMEAGVVVGKWWQ